MYSILPPECKSQLYIYTSRVTDMIEMSCWSSDRLRKQLFKKDSDTNVPWQALKNTDFIVVSVMLSV